MDNILETMALRNYCAAPPTEINIDTKRIFINLVDDFFGHFWTLELSTILEGWLF